MALSGKFSFWFGIVGGVLPTAHFREKPGMDIYKTEGLRLNRKSFPLLFSNRILGMAVAVRIWGMIMISLWFVGVMLAKETTKQPPIPSNPNGKAVETLIQQGVEAYRQKDL